MRSSRANGIVELEPLAGERRYSTRELLQLEHAAIERAQRPRPAAAVGRPSARSTTALASRPSITASSESS